MDEGYMGFCSVWDYFKPRLKTICLGSDPMDDSMEAELEQQGLWEESEDEEAYCPLKGPMTRG